MWASGSLESMCFVAGSSCYTTDTNKLFQQHCCIFIMRSQWLECRASRSHPSRCRLRRRAHPVASHEQLFSTSTLATAAARFRMAGICRVSSCWACRQPLLPNARQPCDALHKAQHNKLPEVGPSQRCINLHEMAGSHLGLGLGLAVLCGRLHHFLDRRHRRRQLQRDAAVPAAGAL